MANTRPTTVGLIGAVRLCFFLLFAPQKFLAAEAEDSRVLNTTRSERNPEPPAFKVRRAFFVSALLVLSSVAVGYGVGLLGGQISCVSSRGIALLQIAGACLLLWGTLFVRGWEIQSYGGVTLTERVNQWLFRALYCIGTAVLICSLSWPLCAN